MILSFPANPSPTPVVMNTNCQIVRSFLIRWRFPLKNTPLNKQLKEQNGGQIEIHEVTHAHSCHVRAQAAINSREAVLPQPPLCGDPHHSQHWLPTTTAFHSSASKEEL